MAPNFGLGNSAFIIRAQWRPYLICKSKFGARNGTKFKLVAVRNLKSKMDASVVTVQRC